MTRQALPTPSPVGKELALVQAMFDRVAPRYDLLNTVLSMGQDAHWRRVAAHAALSARPDGHEGPDRPDDARPAPSPSRSAAESGAAVLDVAAGTGALSRELLDGGAGSVTAVDLSHPMLLAGARRAGSALHLVAGDALRLPFRSETFDAVTIAFGLRNLPDPRAGLQELARVTRRGGVLVVLEFSRPAWTPFRAVYHAYLSHVLPRVAAALSPAPAAYRYLAESILRWPSAQGLADWIRQNGWTAVAHRPLSGGIVAVHRARRP